MFKQMTIRKNEIREMMQELAIANSGKKDLPAFNGQSLPEIELAFVRAIERDADLRNRLYFFGMLCNSIDSEIN